MTPSIVRFCTRVAFVGLVAAFVLLRGRRHETEPELWDYAEPEDGVQPPDPRPASFVWRVGAGQPAPSPLPYWTIGTTQRQTR
ncbi:MAG: hypothetical protein ACYDCI_06660 [Candidatus Limnocylindrales bacterium]